ncbi:hypothetical protein NH340_JMT07099 [Sarcoptes scabiei]|nr:hypothetical protein NH340_JMT07099 [Sarcoptes scabiei]
MNRPPSSLLPVPPGSVPSPQQSPSPMSSHHQSGPRTPMMGSIHQQSTPMFLPQQQTMCSITSTNMSPMMNITQQQMQTHSNSIVSSQNSMSLGGSNQMGPIHQQNQQQTILSHPPHTINQSPFSSHLPASKQYFCKIGADVVQDIVSKTLELFQQLRSMTPQFSAINHQCEDKKNKIKDIAKLIEALFKKLRKIYEACNDGPGPNSSIQDSNEPKIPLKEYDSDQDLNDDDDAATEFPKFNSEEISKTKTIADDIKKDPDDPSQNYCGMGKSDEKKSPARVLLEKEYKDLIELNKLKNRQIKEIIDRLRKMIWDINTMLAMRRSQFS